MTPQEKANEIFGKQMKEVQMRIPNTRAHQAAAKQLSLQEVEEIIKTPKKHMGAVAGGEDSYEYWNTVKDEISKI